METKEQRTARFNRIKEANRIAGRLPIAISLKPIKTSAEEFADHRTGEEMAAAYPRRTLWSKEEGRA